MKIKLSFIARLALMMGVFLTLTGGLTHTVQAETCTWLGNSTLWATASNWSCGHIPGVSDDVVIPETTADPWINTNDYSISVKSLTIQAGATLRVSECKVTIYLSERLTNQGTLALEDPYGNDDGEIEVRAPVDNDGTIIAEGGTITLRHGGNHTGAFEGDHGEIELKNLNSAPPHTFTADSTISVDEVYLSMWDEAVTFPGTFNRPTAQGGTDLTIAGESLTITNPSDNLGTILLVSSELKYAGTITENLINWGTVSPGASPGRITVQGNYEQVDDSNYDGTLNVELEGTTPGTQYDQILVSGSATLDGTLQVNLINGFTPELDDSFTIMTYTSHTGTFATESLPALGSGLEWEVSYGSTTLTLDVINSGGTIEGTVTYTGAEVGEDVNIGYFTDPNGPPDDSINVAYTDGTYPYTFSGLEDGTYAICALMDLNDSGDPDPNEPFNCYDVNADGDPDPIIISETTSTYTDIDFDLTDPSLIQGTVTYTGSLGVTGPISVSAHPSVGAEPSASSEDIQSGETYSILGLQPGSYFISAYLDVDGSGGPPDPDEPLAWYDEDGDGTPDYVWILTEGEVVTGKNILLEDSLYIYLPLIIR